MIKIKNGCYHYTDTTGIFDINIKINKGDTVCIVGPNGSGKSTLLKLIVGLLPFKEGEYYFKNDKIDNSFLDDNKKVGDFYRHFGFVFQNPDIQLFNATVYDEVAFGLRNFKISEKEVKQRVMDCLEILEITHLQERTPYHLSGGEKKLVTIASVLVMNPDIFIFDEPFSGLSPKYRKLIVRLIKELKSKGKTFIISSHYFNLLSSLVNKIYIFTEHHTLNSEVLLKDIDNLPNFIKYLNSI